MKKIALFVVIPFVLLVSGLVFSLVFNTISFSTLPYKVSLIKSNNNPSQSLSAGKNITGVFTASENNLGIITIKLTKLSNAHFYGNEKLHFRIWEKSNSKVIHESTLLIGSYEQTWTMPMGLPIVQDSKGKEYVFELSSPEENGPLVLKATGIKPKFTVIYKHSISELASSPKNLVVFILRKIYLSFTDLDFLASSAIYFIPIIIYGLVLFVKKQVGIKSAGPYVVFILMTIDIFFISSLYPGLEIPLFAIWILVVKLNKLESSVSFLASLLFVAIEILCLFLSNPIFLSVSSFYVYGMLCIGVIQAAFEVKGKNKSVSYRQFLGTIVKRHE